MTTGTILVQDALRQRGVLADDVAPSTAQLNVGLRFLNRMLASWGNETQMIYIISSDTFTMTPSTAEYSTAVFDSGDGRPIGVNSITLVLSGVTYTVDLIDNQTYNSITFKNVNSIPTVCYYDSNYPDASFHFYPQPYAAFVANVECYRPLSGTIVAATDLVLPDGYEKAIIDNLCVYLNYGDPVTPQMRIDANESRNVLKRKNFDAPISDVSLGKGRDPVGNGLPYRGF